MFLSSYEYLQPKVQERLSPHSIFWPRGKWKMKLSAFNLEPSGTKKASYSNPEVNMEKN